MSRVQLLMENDGQRKWMQQQADEKYQLCQLSVRVCRGIENCPADSSTRARNETSPGVVAIFKRGDPQTTASSIAFSLATSAGISTGAEKAKNPENDSHGERQADSHHSQNHRRSSTFLNGQPVRRDALKQSPRTQHQLQRTIPIFVRQTTAGSA